MASPAGCTARCLPSCVDSRNVVAIYVDLFPGQRYAYWIGLSNLKLEVQASLCEPTNGYPAAALRELRLPVVAEVCELDRL